MGQGYFYTLSAIAQCFAAIIALNAIFVVYRMQVLHSYYANIVKALEDMIFHEEMRKRRKLDKDQAAYELSRMTITDKLFWAKFPNGHNSDVTERANRLHGEFGALDKSSDDILDWFQITLVINGIIVIINLVFLPWQKLIPCTLQYILLLLVLLWSVFALLVTIHMTLTILGRPGFYKIEQILLFVLRRLGFARYAMNIDSRKTYQLIKAIQKGSKMIDLGIYQTKDGKEYDCNYSPANKIAEAIGSLPEDIGSRGVAYRVKANTERDAKKNLKAKIGPGHFVD